MVLKDYDVVEEKREIIVPESREEQLLKLFQGTLLTEGKSSRSIYTYTRTVVRFREYINKPITEATTMDIRVWLAYMQAQVSLATCENYRLYLSAFFQWLTVEEFIDKNPMVKVKPIKHLKKEQLAFSSTEIDAIRSACGSVRNRAVIELLLSSGVRVEELTNLNKSDVNFSTLEVHVKCGKGGKARTTYMSEIAAMHLQKYLDTRNDESEAVFISNKRGRISTGCIREACHNLEKVSGVENIHPHRFRRTFATNLWSRGMDIRTIQILMGHSNINTTMTYIANDGERVKAEYKRHA